jgi:hypothetical protein
VNKIKELEREDQGILCKKELQFQMELKLMAGDKAGAKGIQKILKAEETREMQIQLKWANPRTDVGITAVRVPADGDYSTDHCKKYDSWQTLDDPTEVRRHSNTEIKFTSPRPMAPFPLLHSSQITSIG